jgi:hypothetical protein
VFRIGGNTFYNWKNKIVVKILKFKRSGIGLIAEFRGILNGFPNQDESLPLRPSSVISTKRWNGRGMQSCTSMQPTQLKLL